MHQLVVTNQTDPADSNGVAGPLSVLTWTRSFCIWYLDGSKGDCTARNPAKRISQLKDSYIAYCHYAAQQARVHPTMIHLRWDITTTPS